MFLDNFVCNVNLSNKFNQNTLMHEAVDYLPIKENRNIGIVAIIDYK